MEIRKYQPSDKLQLIRLWKDIFSNKDKHNDPSEIIHNKLKIDALIFVAIENKEIIGACIVGYDGHRGWLYALAVYPKFRRNRVASQLVVKAKQTLGSLGCSKFNLQIRSNDESLVKFYTSLGFTSEERISMVMLI